LRGYHLERRYGLTEDEVAALLDGQGGFCLICLHRHSGHVGHDHASGEIRGVLCFRCNAALGQFKDDPWVLRSGVVRSRRAVQNPGWDIGRIGGHDFAVLRALARGDGGDLWEGDLSVAGDEVTELRFPALDLTDPAADAPVPAEPPDPAEYAGT
jgi:Recombination endonuclease VII